MIQGIGVLQVLGCTTEWQLRFGVGNWVILREAMESRSFCIAVHLFICNIIELILYIFNCAPVGQLSSTVSSRDYTDKEAGSNPSDYGHQLCSVSSIPSMF
jgi:hypothetical protein